MTRTIGILSALIASFFFGSVARADAEDIAARGIAAIQDVAQLTVERIAGATDAGVARIERLDLQGATDRELRQAAALSVRTINGLAQAGKQRVARIVQNTVYALRELEAGPVLIHSVRDAGQAAHDVINAAAADGVATIESALETALNN